MKKKSLNQTAMLLRKAIWLFAFASLVFSKDIFSSDFFAGLSENLSVLTTESKKEMPRQSGQNQSTPFPNSGEEKADCDSRSKHVEETIYSRNKRIVSEKAKAVNGLSYAVIYKIPEDDLFPNSFPNPANTCFAQLHRFSVF
jgi:hypothetical protein